jgi:hypothetical protein
VHSGVDVIRTQTPPRSVRVPDALWEAFKEAAEHRGETATDALLRAMQSYVNRNHPSRLRGKV